MRLPQALSLLDALLGRRLPSWRAEEEKVGAARGVAVLGLDGLASAAYGPEAMLTVLLPLGAAGLAAIQPLTGLILGVLAILYFSYRQTIAAYPNGGGSYTVAKENLGTAAGLGAAAALLMDYILNVAVAISAGVGALVSAIPALHDHILLICLMTLGIITVINLRGLRESSIVFSIPTFTFVASLGAVIAIGIWKSVTSGGHPAPVVAPPELPRTAHAATVWLLMRAFSSGCTAMTGVEAISNGIPAFREPAVRNARRSLTALVIILGTLLIGIAYLTREYGILAMRQETVGYQSVLSLLIAAVVGRGVFYYVAIVSVLAVLALSANTSFAGFPRLCRIIAGDDYLPRGFTDVGRRLVHSIGIVVLALLAATLLIAFGGITDRLIPLFAIGAFGAFTLSQAGMVVHWLREGGNRVALMVNLVGAIITFTALVVITVTKFHEGAWVTFILVPGLLVLFARVKRYYRILERQIAADEPLEIETEPPVVVMPIKEWNHLTEKALRFAMTMSPDIIAIHAAADPEHAKQLQLEWVERVERPLVESGRNAPPLHILASPYRELERPIVEFIERLRDDRQRLVAVIIPDLVERRWWEHLLHHRTGHKLRRLLIQRGNQRVVVISVPWYLDRRRRKRR